MPKDCWIWLGDTNNGYGRIKFANGSKRYVHRLSWEQFNGPIPGWAHLHHLCAVKRCYNPTHLLPVGHLAHMYLERIARGVCKKGHPLDAVNLSDPDALGRTRCRICRLASKRRNRAENPEAHREVNARYRARHVQKVAALKRRWYVANRDRILAKAREKNRAIQ